MRIALVGSCLEARIDGVGDYSRHLAEAFLVRGNLVCLVSLNDHSTAVTLSGSHQVNAGAIPYLRLPAGSPWGERALVAREYLEQWRPDIISLQFVAFGFHPKGLDVLIGLRLRSIFSGWPVHIMFHELWVGLGVPYAIKWRLWGWAQRLIIHHLVTELEPARVHTSNALYARALAGLGIAAGVIPVFSNIPVAAGNGWMNGQLRTLGIDETARSSFLICGIFGTIRESWEGSAWWSYLMEAARQARYTVALVGIGKVSHKGLCCFLQAGKSKGIMTRHLGPQPPENVSDFLQAVDLGISMTGTALAAKSGALAAIEEHGLAVIMPEIDFGPDTELDEELKARIRLALAQLGRGRKRVASGQRLSNAVDSLSAAWRSTRTQRLGSDERNRISI